MLPFVTRTGRLFALFGLLAACATKAPPPVRHETAGLPSRPAICRAEDAKQPAASTGDPVPDQTLAAGTGAIQGVVRDLDNRPISDVTVVVTAPALQGSASELTHADGAYDLPDLPPGTYEVIAYYGEIKLRQGNVAVGAAKVTSVILRLDTSATGGEVIDVTQKAPTIMGDSGPGPRDPSAPHGGRLWPNRGIAIGQDYTRHLSPAPAPAPCKPR